MSMVSTQQRIQVVKDSSSPLLSLFVHLFRLPPHSRCWRSLTSWLRPRPWWRKTPPTGRALRWRLKPLRDREIQIHPNNLSHTHIFQKHQKWNTDAVTEASFSSKGEVQWCLFIKPKITGSSQWTSDTFCPLIRSSDRGDTRPPQCGRTSIKLISCEFNTFIHLLSCSDGV